MAIALPLQEKILLEHSKDTRFRVLKAQFGDGYSQRIPDGINTRIDSWTIKWGALSKTEKLTVEGVLISVGGWGILTWTPTGETVEKKFILADGSYTTTYVNREVYQIETKLIEVFDNGI